MLVDSTNVKNGKTVNGRKAIGEFNSTKGEIVLDIGSDDVVATTLHEVTHYIKLNAPTQYNALRDAVIEYATKTGKIEYYLEKYANSYGTDNVYELTEEMTSDAAEALLTNEKFINELLSDKSFVNAVVGENKGFVRKFLDTLHDIISSIKDYLKGRNVNHQIARELSEDVKALEKIEKLWRDALTAAVNNHAKMTSVKENTDTESSGGVKYSKKEDSENSSIKQQIKNNLDKLNVTDSVADVFTPTEFKNMKVAKQWIFDVLKNTGYAVDRQNFGIILFDEKLINESLNYINSFTEMAAFATLPKVLKRGVLIDGHPDHKSRNYSTITIAAKVTINSQDGIVGVVVKRTNANNFKMLRILSPDGSEFSFTEKKKNSTLTGKGLPQRALANPTDAVSNNSISLKSDDVNPYNKKSLSETESDVENIENIYGYKIKQGIKVNENLLELLSIYDKNAKVDTNGNVTVYHRTNADAAEKIRKTGIMIAKEDALFFSSEDNGYASDYGDTVITLKIPSTVLEVNDVFDGEVHFDLPLRYKNGVYSLNVSQYLKDTDTKFSLSEPVEEKGNLIAVHNIYTDKLVKSLKLGGFPMPSIAVIKSDVGHGNYGECSFVFDKSTIDPKTDKRNKVYGGDAWTPTYPAIEYKASEDVIQRVKDTREHNLFGNDGTFMHCSGSTFFLRQRRLFRLRLRLLPELHRFSLRYLRVCSAFRLRPRWCRRLFYGIGEVLCFISGFVKALVSFFKGGVSLELSSRSMPFGAACALFSCICQFWVRRSFSPKDSAAFARAERSVSIFCFCWSISLFRTSLRTVRASVDLSFLSNWESTSFISEPSTLNELFISARDFLNSRSPSRTIFKPKFSDILRHLLEMGIKKEPCGSGDI